MVKILWILYFIFYLIINIPNLVIIKILKLSKPEEAEEMAYKKVRKIAKHVLFISKTDADVRGIENIPKGKCVFISTFHFENRCRCERY